MPNRTAGRHRKVSSLAVGAFIAALVASCSTGSGSSAPTTATPPVSSSPSPSGSAYSSTSFVVPFDVEPPAWLDPTPTVEQANFVTWEAPNVPAVRFLAPETVYRPGEKKDTAVPKDYLAYLLGQTSAGGHFRDQTTSTIGGQSATLLTATTDKGLDGSLGCPAKGTLAPACFGLQEGLELRMALLQVNGKQLLIWLRLDTDMKPADVATHIASFDAMLASLRFETRPVQSAAPAAGTPIDGTYQMIISWPRIKTADARCVGGSEGTSAKVVYDLILDRGSLTLWVRVGGLKATREVGLTDNYRILNDHQLTFGDVASLDFTVDSLALTLSHMRGGDCGGNAIFTTKPWIRQ